MVINWSRKPHRIGDVGDTRWTPPTISAQISNTDIPMKNFPVVPDTEATVVLFGWAGCRERYLSKYSEFYEENGYTAIKYIASTSKLCSLACYRTPATQLYDILRKTAQNKPILFHVFSMNGCSLFTVLWDLLDEVTDGDKIKKNVRGIIFDSCPANVTPCQAANAFSLAALQPNHRCTHLLRQGYRFILTIAFSFHRVMLCVLGICTDDADESSFTYARLEKTDDLPPKQLYLYSIADKICSAKSIEKFLNSQKKIGRNVQTHCWQDSEHVDHLRKYPDVYKKLCINFMESLLTENKF